MTTVTAVQNTFNMNLSSKAKMIYNYLAFRSNYKNISCFPFLKRMSKRILYVRIESAALTK